MPKSSGSTIVDKYSNNLDEVSKLFKAVSRTETQKAELDALLKWYDSVSKKLAQNPGFFGKDTAKSNLFSTIASLKELIKGGDRLNEVLESIGKGNDKLAKKFKDLVEGFNEVEENIEKVTFAFKIYDKSVETGDKKKIAIAEEVLEALAKEKGVQKELNKLLKERADAEEEKRIDRLTQGIEKTLGTIKSVSQTIKGVGEDIMGPWAKAHQAAADYAKAVGMSGTAMNRFREDTINFVNDQKISANYNTSIEELIKLQQEYSAQTDRNIRLSNSQKETFVATARVMGNEKAIDFTAKLENFGIGMEKSGKLAKDMFDTASKSGVNFEKYTKNVTDNLTLVQSYGFRNGVQGLATMARKATELKLNMQQVAAFADKVSTVEGAITTAANLQVLGGPFSMYSDPMSMLYEGLNDLEGLQDRMVKMMSNLGNFNKETGQVQLNAFNRVRVKEAAKNMGVSAEEMFKMINRAGVMNEIQNQLQNTGIAQNEEMMTYLKNVATFNKNGEAVVDLGDGRGEVKVSELNTDTDLAKLRKLNQTEGEDIRDIAKMLRGWDDIMQGTKKQVNATKAQAIERTGLGKTVLGIANTLGNHTDLLRMIAYGQMFGSIAQGALGIGGNIRGAGKFFGKDSPTVVSTAGRGVGSTAGSGAGNYGSYIGGKFNPANKVTTNGRGNQVVKIKGGREFELSPNGKSKPAQWREVGTGRYAKAGDAAKAAKTLKAGSKAAKIMASRWAGMAAGGVAAGAMSGLMHLMAGDFKRGGGIEGREQRSKAIAGTVGAGLGGALGALIPIPVVGEMLGAAAGEFLGSTIGGAIAKKRTKNRDEKREEIINDFKYDGSESGRAKARAFASLEGDYTRKELERLKRALADGKIDENDKLSNKLLRKISESGDSDKLNGLNEVIAKSKFGEKMNVKDQHNTVERATFNIGNGATFNTKEMGVGGFIEGPSHRDGGAPILGTNISVEGGEYVVNKEATAAYLPILEKINTEKTFSKLDVLREIFNTTSNTKFSPGGVLPNPLTTVNSTNNAFSNTLTNNSSIINKVPTILKQPEIIIKPAEGNAKSGIQPLTVVPSKNEIKESAFTGGKLEISPLKIDISGTINLAGGGKNIDITELIKNPGFMTQISQLIENRISESVYGGNFKESRKNKTHTFM